MGDNVGDLAASLGNYNGRWHYLICVVAARLAGKNCGPIKESETQEALRDSLYKIFDIEVSDKLNSDKCKALFNFCHLV